MDQSKLGPADRWVTLPNGLPRYSLGWGNIKWAMKYLRQPDGDHAGERWKFTQSQIRFILWWYALDEDAQWVYSHGVRRLPKGAGKSPFAAVMSIIELCGPVRFAKWVPDPSNPGDAMPLGKAIGMPLVEIAATAESQATVNTMTMVTALIAATNSDGTVDHKKKSRLITEYGLDVGKTQINKPGGGFLHVITSSASAAEGARTTFGICDQAADLNTPIPTPGGWATVKEIQEGDKILGRNGKPCTVTHVTPVRYNRDCYRVTFRDGHSIVADAGHLWLVSESPGHSDAAYAAGKIRTTREMAESGRHYFVPLTAPVDLPEASLPIDPYVLGAWLGDGHHKSAALCAGQDDWEWMLAELQKFEPQARVRAVDPRNGVRDITLAGADFTARLRALGVFGNKHIPDAYMRASREQRQNLLQGLMDTDGCALVGGGATFVQNTPRLAEQVAELARSLGYKAHTSCKPGSSAPIMGRALIREPSNRYKVDFRADPEVPAFRMPRKAKRMRLRKEAPWMAIASIDPVESVPVKCIEVDSPDHLFLAGKSWIATHNTEAWVKANGGHKLFEVMDRNAAKGKNRLVQTANAWEPGSDSTAERTYDAWVEEQEGRQAGTARTLMDIRMAPPDTVRYFCGNCGAMTCDCGAQHKIIDRNKLVEGVTEAYGDCNWSDPVDIVDRHILDLKTPFPVSKRFYLNWPTVSEDAWCEPQEWNRWGDPNLVLADGAEIALGFDGSRANDATALIACEIESGDVFEMGIWETKALEGGGRMPIPVGEVDAAVERAFERWNPVAFFADVREWESFVKVTWPERYASRLKIMASPGTYDPQSIAWDMRIRTAQFTMAAEMVHGEVCGDECVFRHDGSSLLAKHVKNMRIKPNKFGTSVGKESPDSPNKIDAGVAMIIARHARRMYLSSEQTAAAKAKPKSGQVWSYS